VRTRERGANSRCARNYEPIKSGSRVRARRGIPRAERSRLVRKNAARVPARRVASREREREREIMRIPSVPSDRFELRGVQQELIAMRYLVWNIRCRYDQRARETCRSSVSFVLRSARQLATGKQAENCYAVYRIPCLSKRSVNENLYW